jgi:hypothetical protein
MKYNPSSMVHNRCDIKFENEDGLDAGGPSREWINLIMK